MSNTRKTAQPYYSAFGRPGDLVNATPEEKEGFLSYIPFMKGKRASRSSTTASSPDGSEHRGIFGAAVRGMNKMTGKSKSATSAAQRRAEEASFLMDSDRIMYFVLFLGIGFAFIFLAFMFLPTIVFAPQKFALLFTLGSICMIASLVVIKGVSPLVKHLFSKKKILYSLAYFGSLFGTVYASVVTGSYLLTLLSAAIQMVSLFALLVSYVPGGPRFLGFLRGQGVTAAKGMAGMEKSNPQSQNLPV
eukprot:Lankesteria_metandrocarpae@DN890_c0_g1_i1.p1